MKNKFLLSMGTVAAAAVPMITVVACGENTKTPLEQQLDKIQNMTSTRTLTEVATYLDNLDPSVAGSNVDITEAGIGITAATLDDGYDLKFSLKTDWTDGSLTAEANTFMLVATVTDANEATATKDVTITVDGAAPEIAIDTEADILSATITDTDGASGTLVFPNATTGDWTATKALIEGLFSATDDVKTITLDFTWSTDLDFASPTDVTLTVTADDGVNTAVTYSLVVSVASGA